MTLAHLAELPILHPDRHTKLGLSDDDVFTMCRTILLSRRLDQKIWSLNRMGKASTNQGGCPARRQAWTSLGRSRTPSSRPRPSPMRSLRKGASGTEGQAELAGDVGRLVDVNQQQPWRGDWSNL